VFSRILGAEMCCIEQKYSVYTIFKHIKILFSNAALLKNGKTVLDLRKQERGHYKGMLVETKGYKKKREEKVRETIHYEKLVFIRRV
jgi:hypothetical protein